jgi:cytochrome c
MKKYVITFSLLFLLAACGNDSNKNSTSTEKDTTAVAANDITANPDYQKGLAQIGTSDCSVCHKPTEKVTGPAFQDIANKYAGIDTAIKYLTHKIKTGGKGVWGQVAMTPHDKLPDTTLEQMVKYILLLKTN